MNVCFDSDLYEDDSEYHDDSQYQEVCIRYSDVNRAIRKAMHILNYKKPKEIDSLEVAPDTIGETAEVTLKATELLTEK